MIIPQLNSLGWDLGQDGKLWNGSNGRSSKLSYSSDDIVACICSNVDLRKDCSDCYNILRASFYIHV